MQNLYSENYSILLKEMKEDLHNWGQGFYVNRLEDWILLRWQYSPNWSTDSKKLSLELS